MAAPINAVARDRLLDALAAGESLSTAARTSGFARQSVYRLLRSPAFLEDLRLRRLRRPWPGDAARTAETLELALRHGEDLAAVKAQEQLIAELVEEDARRRREHVERVRAERKKLEEMRRALRRRRGW